jgi:TonB family protein
MLKRPYSILLASACLVMLAAITPSARAQGDDWQIFSPEGEEFSVSMPKDPKFEDGQSIYHRMTLNTRLYLSQPDKGPVLAVASMSGIKANSAMYTEYQRLNSYVDAFKDWFPAKVRGKDALAKLTLVGEKVLNGNNGREYTVVIGDLSGTAHMYATRRRFYAVVILNTKKDEKLTERFLSSLTLPEKTTAPTVAAPAAKPASIEGADEDPKPGTVGAGTAEMKPDPNAPDKKAGEPAPINGGILNNKALYLPTPEYPPIAAQAKASGAVNVQILIDEMGNIISAHAINGHPLLQATSVAAARQARFSPTSLSGVPVKVSGILQFNFTAP